LKTAVADRSSEAQALLFSDLFHQLSQPLTALQCALELSLARDRTAEQFRSSVALALENSGRLRACLLRIRALRDADDPGHPGTVAVEEIFRLLHEEMLPLLEAAAVCWRMEEMSASVQADRAKLKAGLFHLFLHLLEEFHRGELRVRLQEVSRRRVQINITLQAAVANGNPDGEFLLEIARRSFRAMGGELILCRTGGVRPLVEIRICLQGGKR